MKYTIEKISNSNFVEFGDFINPYDKKAEDINTNTTKSYFDLANIEILGADNKARLNLFDAKKREFPLMIDMLEQHPFSSQVFLPLSDSPFFVIVCPKAIEPDLNNLKIFKIENGNGVNFKPQVWHFPLISINNAKFITVDKKNADNNLKIYNFAKEEKFYFNG